MHPRPRLQTIRARRRRHLSKQLMQMHPRPRLQKIKARRRRHLS